MLGVSLSSPVRSISSWPAVDVPPSATIRQAAERLSEELVGVLVVADPRGILGIVSERDIVRALADGADPDAERVSDVMTDDIATMDGDVSILEAADAMEASEIRHMMIVVDDRFAGIVSMRDVIRVTLEELEAANGKRLVAG
jgi:CBS domain-containing protein